MNHHQTVDGIVQEVEGAITDAKLEQLDAIAARLVAARDEVRVHGVEAGRVKLTGGPERMFTPSNLDRHFGGTWEDPGATSLPWRDPRVRRYLAAAADAVASGNLGDREWAVEAATLRSVERGQAWPYQTPVKYPDRGGGIAFSFPLPIRARGGVEPARGSSAGYPDILARAGQGSSSRLRILELKAPGAGDAGDALDQAVAYPAALRVLFERAPAYRTLLGYGPSWDRVPPLEATAFVDDTPRSREELQEAIERLGGSQGRLSGLRLSACFYRWAGAEPGEVEVTHEAPNARGLDIGP